MRKILIAVLICLAAQANDLRDISIVEFTEYVSKVTNKNIYIDEDLNTSVSFFVPDTINDKDVFTIYKKTLKKQDYNLKKIGDTYYLSKRVKFPSQSHLFKLKFNSSKDIADYLTSAKIKYKYLENINSFVIYIQDHKYKQLEKDLKILDTQQKQVLLKIMIFEYSDTNIKEAGVQWGSIFENISNSTEYALNAIVATFNTTNRSVSSNSFYSAIKLLNENDIISVKQYPYIISKNNRNFKFYAVENIPYLVKTTTTQASNTSEQNSIQYKDVGLKIEGKSILYNDYVSLNISLIVEDIIDLTNNMPRTYKRFIESNTNLNYDEVLVISGLKREKRVLNDYSIPYLSNIPFLGSIFQYKTNSVESLNITISIQVLRPQESHADASLRAAE